MADRKLSLSAGKEVRGHKEMFVFIRRPDRQPKSAKNSAGRHHECFRANLGLGGGGGGGRGGGWGGGRGWAILRTHKTKKPGIVSKKIEEGTEERSKNQCRHESAEQSRGRGCGNKRQSKAKNNLHER